MSHAEDVRAYCAKRYVEPARAAGQREFSIRVGDVHKAMSYRNRQPLVSAAIGTTTFAEAHGIRCVGIDGPMQGSNAVFNFQFVNCN